jgi:hypothetical protein
VQFVNKRIRIVICAYPLISVTSAKFCRWNEISVCLPVLVANESIPLALSRLQTS